MLDYLRSLLSRGRSRPTNYIHNTPSAATLRRSIYTTPSRTANARPSEVVQPIYGPELLAVTAVAEAAMRAEVNRAAEKRVISTPTAQQWEMILSNHPATCVVAGAGSGKSTTLILRVVFLLCHLRVSPQELTVISFTVESCKELREKLYRVLSYEEWKNRLDPDDAQHLQARCASMVSTFHSALYRTSKRAFGDCAWFDFLGSSRMDTTGVAADVDNAMLGSRLQDPQLALLNTAYRTLFTEDPEFRQNVLAMLRLECDRHTLLGKDTGEAKAVALASKRDLELTRLVSARWGDDWIKPGVDPTPCVAFRIDNQPFYANGRVAKTGMPIFLSLDGMLDNKPLFNDAEMIGEGKTAFKVIHALKVKRDNVQRRCDREALHLNTTRRIEWLAYRLNYLVDGDFRNLAAPAFPVHLKGEIAPTDLVEAFYAQATFIESLGMSVKSCTQDMMQTLEPKSLEAHFAAALGRFWPAFEALLDGQAQPIRTFNRAFLDLGEGAAKPVALPSDALRPFTHLLVDEFQDISPQIVSWLRAMQRRVREQGRAPTLMAIGDDWQSIYGWRGSAPEMFIDFARHFPVHAQLGKPRECRMMDNYRSIAPIISDAERIVGEVKIKIDKTAKAVKSTQPGDHGVRLIKGVDVRSSAKQIAEEIHRQLDFVNSLPSCDKNKILVLSRSNAVLKQVRQAFGSADGVRFLTFHGAKGLQAEVAVLCDNSAYEDTHVLRNAVYRASGLFRQGYDATARDEALRLAYVAVTRGIRRVVWFVGEPKGAATTFAQSR